MLATCVAYLYVVAAWPRAAFTCHERAGTTITVVLNDHPPRRVFATSAPPTKRFIVCEGRPMLGMFFADYCEASVRKDFSIAPMRPFP